MNDLDRDLRHVEQMERALQLLEDRADLSTPIEIVCHAQRDVASGRSDDITMTIRVPVSLILPAARGHVQHVRACCAEKMRKAADTMLRKAGSL